MNITSDLIVPKEILQNIHMSPDEMLIELVTHLYEKKKLSMRQAKRLAKLDQLSFQKELAKCNIYLNYDIEEFKHDLEAIKKMKTNGRQD
jgi:predicted HTH domain antitoxin